MENWWKDTDRQKLTYSDKRLFQCQSGHHKTHADWPGIEPVPLLSHGTAQLYNTIFKVVFNIFNIFSGLQECYSDHRMRARHDTKKPARTVCIRVMKTNLMQYLSSVYFVSQPLHVSGIFVAHHQEVYRIYTTIGTCCAL